MEDDKKIKKVKVKNIDDDEEIEDEEEFEELTVEERIVSIEKKVNIVLILVILTTIFSLMSMIFAINNGSTDELTPTTTNNGSGSGSTSSYDTSAFKEIKASEIAAESKNETIVLWVGRQGCGYCAQYAPVIAQAGKDFGITVRYVDMGKMLSLDESTQQLYISDTESFDTVANLQGSGDWDGYAKQYMGGTPLTLIVKNNKVIGGINQAEGLENVEKAFEAAGLKKK